MQSWYLGLEQHERRLNLVQACVDGHQFLHACVITGQSIAWRAYILADGGKVVEEGHGIGDKEVDAGKRLAVVDRFHLP